MVGQEDFRKKWIEYSTEQSDFNHTHRVDSLTPFYGTETFPTLSEADKERLFFEYIKLVSEALILFEQILIYAVYRQRQKLSEYPQALKDKLSLFSEEEFYHLRGFRHFLRIHPVFNWEKNKIYADSTKLKNAFAFILRRFPCSIYLPGAKLEAFTLSYNNMLKAAYKSAPQNSWTKLNHIHMQDEISHLALQFEFHDSMIDHFGLFKTWLGSVLFVGLMQVALAKGSYLVVARALPHLSFFQRIKWTMKMAKWAVRTTSSYKEGRAMTKALFARRKPKYGALFSYITW